MSKGQNIAMGIRIRAVREQAGWTQELLAEMIDISPVHLSRIENGRVTPRVDILMRLSEILQVSMDELLYDEHQLSREFCLFERKMKRLNGEDKRFVFRVFLLFCDYLISRS